MFKKDPDAHERASSKGIFLSNRVLSWFFSFMLLAIFFVFITGYFWGQKKAAERFVDKTGQEVFSDNVYYSLASLYESRESDDENAGDSVEGDDAADEVDGTKETAVELPTDPIKDEPRVLYTAQLIGFGTRKKAQECIDRLKRRGLSVVLRERKGTTARGRSMVWYQVVTEQFDNRDQLMKLVDAVKRSENIKSVHIIEQKVA